MSVLGKVWSIKNTDSASSLTQRLLANRGYTSNEDIHGFLYVDAARDFHDPFLMKDMKRVVERLGKAIEEKERIMIFGDYDVDGITGSAILMRTLRTLGAAVSCRLPHRIEDGYGLREKFIDEFEKLGVKVVITVDNGISCRAAVDRANEKNIDVIITDHHTIPEVLPAAYAFLHPKLQDSGYPFSELTGAGVALKLAQALLMTHRKETAVEETRDLLDLAALGTVADLGELRGENRYIVKEGLNIMEQTRWPGLSRLKEYAGVSGKINTHHIGFMICPRINAAGRISNAMHALNLLIHDGENTETLANMLEQLNRRRQKLMEELVVVAGQLAAEQKTQPATIIAHSTFHGGVIGLLASRCVDIYSKPAIVMEERSESLVGSCRSVMGISVVAALTTAQHLLINFGGHAMAAGFEVSKKKFAEFVDHMQKTIGHMAETIDMEPTIQVECELKHQDLSHETLAKLALLEPFGVGNETPLFCFRKVRVADVVTVGKDKNHIKIITRMNGNTVDCMGFKLGQFKNDIPSGGEIDIVGTIGENLWNGTSKLQITVRDFRVNKGVSHL